MSETVPTKLAEADGAPETATAAPAEPQQLIGADLAGQDLSGMDLQGAMLLKADLRGANLTRANLQGADLTAADLTGAILNEADARGAGFGQANLRDARLFSARLERASLVEADCRGADLRCADLHRARLHHTRLEGADLTSARLEEADLSEANVARALFTRADLRRAELQLIRGFETAQWIGVDIRDVNLTGAYRLRRHVVDENYIHEFRESSRLNRFLYVVWWLTSDCGRSLARWFACTLLLAAAYAVVFSQVHLNTGAHPSGWLTNLYFSVVTLTTLGFGDITPASAAGRIVVMAEVVTGYVMLGGLLSIFANKIARRGD